MSASERGSTDSFGRGKQARPDASAFEAIYYPTPIPNNLATLNVLGAVFDRVYFPGVYIPTSGFDQNDLDKEIARIKAIPQASGDRDDLLGMLQFIRVATEVDGLCVFTGSKEDTFSTTAHIPKGMVEGIYEAIWGPPKANWNPTFRSAHYKSIPGSDEHISYRGQYHHFAGAILESANTGIPLLTLSGLPIPGISDGAPMDNARALSAILAIECVRLALPQLPLLEPKALMEFRAENTEHFARFRRAMLRYAADLNSQIAEMSAEDFERKTEFFVQTEIVPAVEELRAAMQSSIAPWYRHAINMIRVIPELGTSFFTMDTSSAIAKVMAKFAGQFFEAVTARNDSREAMKRSGLYYLLRLEHRS